MKSLRETGMCGGADRDIWTSMSGKRERKTDVMPIIRIRRPLRLENSVKLVSGVGRNGQIHGGTLTRERQPVTLS